MPFNGGRHSIQPRALAVGHEHHAPQRVTRYRSRHFLDSGGSNWCYPEVDCRLAAEARYRDHPGGWQAK